MDLVRWAAANAASLASEDSAQHLRSRLCEAAALMVTDEFDKARAILEGIPVDRLNEDEKDSSCCGASCAKEIRHEPKPAEANGERPRGAAEPQHRRIGEERDRSSRQYAGWGTEMSGAGLSAGAAPVRVSGRAIDSGSRGASNDQGGSTGFPDLLSKMGAADSAPAGRSAISMQERRSTWGAAASRTASAQDEANDDAEAALAALLAGQSERSMEAVDQSATGQQPVTSPPDTALAGMRGGADGGSMWSAAVQMQALMTTGVGVPQGTSETTGGSTQRQTRPSTPRP